MLHGNARLMWHAACRARPLGATSTKITSLPPLYVRSNAKKNFEPELRSGTADTISTRFCISRATASRRAAD